MGLMCFVYPTTDTQDMRFKARPSSDTSESWVVIEKIDPRPREGGTLRESSSPVAQQHDAASSIKSWQLQYGQREGRK